MNTQRMEGAVLVMLLAVSAVGSFFITLFMLIVGACCMISGRFFKLDHEQEVRAGVVMLDDGAMDGAHEANMRAFLV